MLIVNVFVMEYIIHGSKKQIDSSFFTYFGAISFKRMRRLDRLTTDLGHALVVCDLTQIPAEGSGCRWGAVGIPDHDSLSMRDQDL